MPSFFIKLDSASWQRAVALLEGVDRNTLDMRPAWEKVAELLRVREVGLWAAAVGKAANSSAPSHASYLARKAAGRKLNGPKWGSLRAAPGAGPLTATGRAQEALIKPETLELRALDMYMGVRVRDAGGRFAGDLAHIVPLQKRYGISRRPSLTERNEMSQFILRYLEGIRG